MQIALTENIEIHFLQDHPEVIPQLLDWNFNYWREILPELEHQEWVDWYNDSLAAGKDSIPTCFVAFNKGELLGSVVLCAETDLRDFPQYSPWVDGLIIREDQRGAGLGNLLMRRIIAHASQIGYETIYLWTEARANWYARNGWKTIAEIDHNGLPGVIMSYRTSEVNQK